VVVGIWFRRDQTAKSKQIPNIQTNGLSVDEPNDINMYIYNLFCCIFKTTLVEEIFYIPVYLIA